MYGTKFLAHRLEYKRAETLHSSQNIGNYMYHLM